MGRTARFLDHGSKFNYSQRNPVSHTIKDRSRIDALAFIHFPTSNKGRCSRSRGARWVVTAIWPSAVKNAAHDAVAPVELPWRLTLGCTEIGEPGPILTTPGGT
jgi:hypothetical protein